MLALATGHPAFGPARHSQERTERSEAKQEDERATERSLEEITELWGARQHSSDENAPTIPLSDAGRNRGLTWPERPEQLRAVRYPRDGKCSSQRDAFHP